MSTESDFLSADSAESVVRIVNPLAEPDWDRELRSLPEYSLFHSASWAQVLHDTYRYVPCYFALYHQQNLAALVPVMEVTSFLKGRRGVSLPFTDACSALASDPRDLAFLLAKVQEYGQKRKWKYLECRGSYPLSPQTEPSLSFHGHCLDLRPGEGQLFAGLKSELRTAIRKARRGEVRLEMSQELDAVEAFYALHCRTRKKHGVPPQPYAFFENIYRAIVRTGQGSVVLAWQGTRPIAGAVLFHLGRTVIYKFAASDQRFQHLRANNLVVWHAIQWASQNRFDQFDFGRTSLNDSGLRRFKLGWGAREKQINYSKYNFAAREFTRDRELENPLLLSLFRLLPVGVLRLIGALLYRQAP